MISQHAQRRLELVLFDIAVRSEVPAGGASRYQVFAGQEGQRSRVVVVGEMHLGQPERIRITVCSNPPNAISRYSKQAVLSRELTRQRKHFITDVDGRIVLTAIQRILPPGPQGLLHGQLRHAVDSSIAGQSQYLEAHASRKEALRRG